ncbi:MAG: hypothetical protein M3Z24_03610, partial [Chloroflexota bacterium]|nr:hypothetical protein [Chloroflexota bacterium]
MHFSRCSKMSHMFVLVAVTAIVSSLMVSSPLFRSTSTRAAANAQHDVRKGTIAPTATVNISKFSSVNGAAPSAKHLSKVLRHFQPLGALGQEPTALNSSSEEPPVGALLSNFNGTSSLDSAVTNFGAEFEPPDQGLCVGNGFVLEPVNSAFRIYRPNGSTVIGPLNVNDLFAEGPKEFTSDPRCQYDKTTNRWFASILFISADNTSARTDIAVSNSGDPTQDWTVYHLGATDNGMNGEPKNSGCPCFGDQPLIGLDSSNLYISTNEFSILGPQFNGAQIYALSKSQLIARAHANFVQFENLRIGGAKATSVQPAITYGQADAEYFLNSLDPNGTTDNRLGVWAITNRNAVTVGSIPTLSRMVISSERYGVPPPALQKGASSTIDSGDDRMQQVQFINGDLWGALGTKVRPQNDTQVRAGIAWFRVRPQLNGAVIGNATIKNQGYV